MDQRQDFSFILAPKGEFSAVLMIWSIVINNNTIKQNNCQGFWQLFW